MHVETDSTRVVRFEDARGAVTVSTRDIRQGEILFQEPALVVVYPARDLSWLAALRKGLEARNASLAWTLCTALHLLTAEDWGDLVPPGLPMLSRSARAQLMELCASDDGTLAELAAWTVGELSVGDAWGETLGVADRLADVASRVLSNGFEVVDMFAKPPTHAHAVFHRTSFLNHSCKPTATWEFDSATGMTVRASRDVAAGEELTISYIQEPWLSMRTQPRKQYLKQTFRFDCACAACLEDCHSAPGDRTLESLLHRWLTGRSCGPCGASRPRETEMTWEQRLQRVMDRCNQEHLDVSHVQASEILQQESGHVGKTVIKLRRCCAPPRGFSGLGPALTGSALVSNES